MANRKYPNHKRRVLNQNKQDPYGVKRQKILYQRMLDARSCSLDFDEELSHTPRTSKKVKNIYKSPAVWHKSSVSLLLSLRVF
jgi:hypothetical protein